MPPDQVGYSEVFRHVRAGLANWVMYDSCDVVRAVQFNESQWGVEYWSPRYGHNPANRYLSLNFDLAQRQGYLLHIWIPAAIRGTGAGCQLYAAAVDIAQRMGCRRIQQTASGHTANKKSRYDYLLRHGWLPLPNSFSEVYKDLPLCTETSDVPGTAGGDAQGSPAAAGPA